MNPAKLAAMMKEVALRMEEMPGKKVAVACNDLHDAKRMYNFLSSEPRPCEFSVTYFEEDTARNHMVLKLYEP